MPDPTTPTTNGEAEAAVLEDDDELLEAGEADLDDVPELDDLDLDEPEPPPDDAAIDELADDFGPDDIGEEPLGVEPLGVEPLDLEPRLAAFEPPAPELEPRVAALEGAGAAAGDGDLGTRLSRLELAAQALVTAQVDRDGRRVHRKVSAASIGAFVAAAIPVLLDLVGALDLSPQVTSAISAGAALLGAFAAGWVTPERQPTLPAEILRT